MKALVKQYHDRLVEASKVVVGISKAAVPLAPSKVYTPTDSRFLSGDAVAVAATATQAAAVKPQGAPSRAKIAGAAAAPSVAAVAAAPAKRPPPQGGVISVDEDDTPVAAPAGAKVPRTRSSEGFRKSPSMPTPAAVSQAGVLDERSHEGIIKAFFNPAPGVAARLLQGRRRQRGEVDPMFILITSIHCGNQVQGVLHLVFSSFKLVTCHALRSIESPERFHLVGQLHAVLKSLPGGHL